MPLANPIKETLISSQVLFIHGVTDYVLPKEMEGYDSGDPEWNARLIAWREASDGEFDLYFECLCIRCTLARA